MNAKKLLNVKLNHKSETLDKILKMSEKRFSEIVADSINIFDEEEHFSKAIERIAEKYNGNEFALALLTIAFAKMIENLEELKELVEEVRYIG